MLTRVGVLLILVLVVSGCGGGNNFSDIKTKAAQGDTQAQYILGVMYASGRGVPRTMPKR